MSFLSTTITGAISYNNPCTNISIRSKYNVLGKDLEIDGCLDSIMIMYLSLINTIGIEYYVELKKNSVVFDGKIGEMLEEELLSYNRNMIIEKIIKEK